MPTDISPELSIVVPCYREAEHLELMVTAVANVIAPLEIAFELVVVDDGSPDDTYARLCGLTEGRPWLRGLQLSRNFGKEAALQAGLKAARGRAVVTMDADLQHPPTVIPQMLEAWREGAQIVHATKLDRSIHGHIYSLSANLFTTLLSRITGIQLYDASDFKLLDREIVDILVYDLKERGRFYRGLAQWVGFNQAEIPFTVAEGSRDERRWTLRGLLNLAVTAVVSFTSLPMHIVTLLGIITLLLSIGLGSEACISWLHGEAVSGFMTLLCTLLILGSFVMISLGIIGVYLAKIYEEIKQRPHYLVRSRTEVRGGISRADTLDLQNTIPTVFGKDGYQHRPRMNANIG